MVIITITDLRSVEMCSQWEVLGEIKSDGYWLDVVLTIFLMLFSDRLTLESSIQIIIGCTISTILFLWGHPYNPPSLSITVIHTM